MSDYNLEVQSLTGIHLMQPVSIKLHCSRAGNITHEPQATRSLDILVRSGLHVAQAQTTLTIPIFDEGSSSVRGLV